jgi:epoxyqueuosine reductase QueG
MDPSGIVRGALAGSGIELVGSCSIAAYDAEAPEALRSAQLFPCAKGVVVAASAGPALWRQFRARVDGDPALWDAANPYDTFVAALLGRADEALLRAGVRHERFEAAFHATPRLDFLALARLAGLGSPGPFLLSIHDTHGPWWALRGAWLVDAEVAPALSHRPPCEGCPAPCVGGDRSAASTTGATVEVRSRCIVGQSSRYDDDQIAYHYDREATRERLRRTSAFPTREGQ